MKKYPLLSTILIQKRGPIYSVNSEYVFALFLQFDDLIDITLGWVGLDQTTIKVMRVK